VAQAKPIIKNKFWIVEEDGIQVGTIQSVPDGVVLVKGHTREKFASFKLLSTKHNIHSAKSVKKSKSITNSVHDYPTDSFPYNPIYDLKFKLPLYTKEEKSKSFYCAGYYLINVEGTWIPAYCPKKIVLSRNAYFGPFKNKDQLSTKLSEIRS
jgi:hypothetical protein